MMRSLLTAALIGGFVLVIPLHARPPFSLGGGGGPPGLVRHVRRLPMMGQAEVQVQFDGSQVYIASTLDVSNAVLEYYDGSQQKFDNLQGRTGRLQGTGRHAGKQIVRVWVKSGANLSGDGPGYGQRFDAPPQSTERTAVRSIRSAKSARR